jgi:hypothetical protein
VGADSEAMRLHLSEVLPSCQRGSVAALALTIISAGAVCAISGLLVGCRGKDECCSQKPWGQDYLDPDT